MLLLLLLAPAAGWSSSLHLRGQPAPAPAPLSSRLRCCVGSEPQPPSTAQIRAFAVPALALWLQGPLLSLIDTSAVGLTAVAGSGASQLAALGPATTFCDGVSYLFAFLNVATTNLVSTAQARVDAASGGGDAEVQASVEQVVQSTARVAVACGALGFAVFGLNARRLLELYVGGVDPNQLALSSRYIRIRTLVLPAALLGNALQAASLGAKDSVTPLLAGAVAAVANVLGDAVCVVWLRKGVLGAALATAASQLAGTLCLVRSARRKLVPTSGLGLDLRGMTRGTTRGITRVVTRGMARNNDALDLAPGLAPSLAPGLAEILRFAAPVLTLILGKIAAFGFMTHVAASLGEVSLASHQIVLTLFFCFSPALEVLSQTAQAFLPRYEPPFTDEEDAPAAILASNASSSPPGRSDPNPNPDPNPNRNPAAWRTASNQLGARLLRLGCLASAACAAAALLLPLHAVSLLTKEAAVAAAVRPLAGPFALSVLLTGPVCAGEGVRRRALEDLGWRGFGERWSTLRPSDRGFGPG